MKLYQKYFPSCFKPRRILSRTRLGSTPSTSAISFTVICINIRIKFPKVNFLHYVPPFRFTGDWRVNRMEAETDTGRQPGHLRKKWQQKKRQISVRENWRAKNSHYYTELHGTIMPMQCYTCPEEEQCFFWIGEDRECCVKQKVDMALPPWYRRILKNGWL